MIITRSPLRISIGGGGTDLPSYYQEHGGFLIAAAINKYVYLTAHQTFMDDLIIKYSQLERVNKIDDIKHPILRETLRHVGVDPCYLELTSMADIPAGTGLGSSGSFTTALLQTLHTLKKQIIHPHRLAEEACHIELNVLKEPIGKQDQFIAAYGGLTCFEFDKTGAVQAYPLKISEETLHNLEENLVLFFTGYTRSASAILKEQDDKSKKNDHSMIDNLHFVKALGLDIKKALGKNDLHEFANLMNTHWEYKKQRSSNMSNNQINEWYELALKQGALGGKMIGAGGGGFLMFYTEDKTKLRHAMHHAGLKEVRFQFDFSGTQVLVQ